MFNRSYPAILFTLIGLLSTAGALPAVGQLFVTQCVSGTNDGAPCDQNSDCPNGFCTNLAPPIACDDCPALLVGTVSGVPGSEVSIAVTFRRGTVGFVAGIQNDLRFDPHTSIVSCTVNSDLQKGASAFHIGPGSMRALILGWDYPPTPIPDRAALYTCTLEIAPSAAPGTYPLRISGIIASNPTGAQIPTSGEDGAVVVAPLAPGSTLLPTRSPTATPTPEPPIDPNTVVTYSVSSVTGHVGDQTYVSVTYSSTGYGTSGIQTRLRFDPSTFIAPRADGRPDCTVNPVFGVAQASVAYYPSRCTPGTDCTGITAVLASSPPFPPFNIDPAGSLLYTCTLQIAATAAPGTYSVRIEDAEAGVSGGMSRFQVKSVDGTVTVTAPDSPPQPRATATATATPLPPDDNPSSPYAQSNGSADPPSAVTNASCAIQSDGATSATPWPLLVGGILVLVRRRSHGPSDCRSDVAAG